MFRNGRAPFLALAGLCVEPEVTAAQRGSAHTSAGGGGAATVVISPKASVQASQTKAISRAGTE